MLAVCSLEEDYRKYSTGARLYTPEQLTMYGLQDEKLVCTFCGTPIYFYDEKQFHHYPNQPHKSEICSYLAYHSIAFDYSRIDVRELVIKWEKIRPKGRKIVEKPVEIDAPIDTGTEGAGADLGSEDPGIDQDPQEPDGSTVEELLISLLQPASTGNEEEKNPSGEGPCEANSLNEENHAKPSEENKNPKEEINWKNFSKIKDFYTAGIAEFDAKKPLGKTANGENHYVFNEFISSRYSRDIFGTGLFTGGARIIEMALDGYCDGRPIGPDYERGPNYLVFRCYWPDGTDAEGKKIWKNVRFLIHYRYDPKFYDEFKDQYMMYDANRRLYVPKNKSQVYTVSAFFKKTNGFCEGKCYRCRQHNMVYCDNCMAQFEAEIVNPKNQMYLPNLDRYVDLGDPEE